MIILFVILLGIILWGIKYSPAGFDDYMSRPQTTAVKGIFAVIILFGHMRGYLPSDYDQGLYGNILNFIGQSMVVMFLFYSGYGIMEALKRDIDKYTAGFFRKRVLKVWILFAVAIMAYVILNLILGHQFTARKWILCWIGWESIGNSNWFVFDIIVLYLLSYLMLLLAGQYRWQLKHVAYGVLMLSFGLVVALHSVGKPSWWFDTIMAYPFGMLYSLYITRLQVVNKWRGVILLAFLLVVEMIGCRLLYNYSIPYLLKVNFLLGPLTFALLIISMTSHFKVNNRVLQWLGVNAFAIYILQRISMILVSHLGWNQNGLVFAAIVIPLTMLIVVLYNTLTNRIIKFL